MFKDIIGILWIIAVIIWVIDVIILFLSSRNVEYKTNIMNNRSRGCLFMAMAMASLAYNGTTNNRISVDEILNKPHQKNKIIPKGCSEYFINGESIIALNHKSALRKASKNTGVRTRTAD